MSSLGPYLRELRQRRGLSLEELSRATRVASSCLEALETENLDVLPAPVFVKGFIRAYCQALDVTPDEALALYHQRPGAPPAPPVRAVVERRGGGEPRSRGTVLVSFVLLVVLGLALFAVTLALQSGREGGDRLAGQAGAPAEPPPVPPDSLEPVPAESVLTPPPARVPEIRPRAPEPSRPSEATPSRPVTPPGPEFAVVLGPVVSPYRLVARVSEPTWVRVRMEDGRATEETIPAGEVREWVSNAPFVLTVGNAGGVTLELNGRPLPPLGARGAVISRLVIPPAGR
jgi:cytoskeleton protein RodZ